MKLYFNNIFILALLTSQWHCSDGPLFEGKSTKSDKDTIAANDEKTPEDSGIAPKEEDSIAEPVWINGSYLVGCSMVSSKSTTEGEFQCYLSEDYSAISTAKTDASMAWAIYSASNEKTREGKVAINSGSGLNVTIPILLDEARTGNISVLLELSTGQVSNYTSPIIKAIRAGKQATAFATCLESGDLASCADEAAINPSPGVEPVPGSTSSHSIFFTSEMMTSNWNSDPTLADAKCAQVARSQNLPGIWIAVVDFTQSKFLTRHISHGPLLNLKGATVAVSAEEFVNSGPLANVTDEAGRFFDSNVHGLTTLLWGLKDGSLFSSTDFCGNWTGAGETYSADVSNLKDFWPMLRDLSITQSCSVRTHLMCVAH